MSAAGFNVFQILDDNLHALCLSFLAGSHVAQSASVSRTWNHRIQSSWLWERLFDQDFSRFSRMGLFLPEFPSRSSPPPAASTAFEIEQTAERERVAALQLAFKRILKHFKARTASGARWNFLEIQRNAKRMPPLCSDGT
eukprot:GABV01009652.1.p1 GENE.GABV01009652.1~~GABV01009652.1.p1  ORF type:complete len:140 (-),score=38.16 GABV01009652.1:110-529(-)